MYCDNIFKDCMASNKKTINESASLSLLRHLIFEILMVEDNAPGGGITDFGAAGVINPDEATRKMTQALKTAKGNVRRAARELGISPSLVYHYSSSEGPIPALHGAIDDSQSGSYQQEKEKEEAEKKKKKLKVTRRNKST